MRRFHAALKRLHAARTVMLAALMLGAPAALGPVAEAAAQDWIRALTELRVAPADLRDTRSPIAERIALAEALGTHGPKEEALAALRAALHSEPEPPPPLAAAIARSIARRAPSRTPEPLATVLRSVDARAARSTERRVKHAPTQAAAGKQPVRAAGHDAIERALCEPATAPDALRMLVSSSRPSDRVRKRVRAALAGSACRDTMHPVADDDPRAERLRTVAAELLGAARDAGAVPPLRAVLLSPFARVRAAAVSALAAIATPAACAALVLHARIEPSAVVYPELQRALRRERGACGGS